MAQISEQDLIDFAYILKSKIQEEFEDKHLSGNLASTVRVVIAGDNKVHIEIPAESYKIYQYLMHGAIIPDGRGSYASELDEKGSAFYVYDRAGGRKFVEPRNHIGYLNRAVDAAISDWMAKMTGKFEEAKVTK